MGVKFNRKKRRVYLMSLAYKFHRFLVLPDKIKIKLYLDLEWIFNRLSHEMSFSQYSPTEHPFRVETFNFLKKYVNKSDKVLDLGCKYGELSFLLAKVSKKVVAIDYDKRAVELAKTNYSCKNLIFLHAEAFEYLNESNENYDLLILSHVLEHLSDPEQFLNMFKGFFKKIYIEVPDFDATYLNQYRMKVGSNLLYTDNDHINEFDRKDIKDLIQSCGLTILFNERRFGVQRLICKVL